MAVAVSRAHEVNLLLGVAGLVDVEAQRGRVRLMRSYTFLLRSNDFRNHRKVVVEPLARGIEVLRLVRRHDLLPYTLHHCPPQWQGGRRDPSSDKRNDRSQARVLLEEVESVRRVAHELREGIGGAHGFGT